ncbi:MAG: chemotaxis protein CheW [Acidimicrobiales bacterium]
MDTTLEAAAGVASQARRMCTFRVADLWLGVQVDDVQEVLRNRGITTVPLAHAAVRGLLNLRGQITTTIDLKRRLELAGDGSEQGGAHLVVRHMGESISLLVDAIDDVIDVDPSTFEPPPETATVQVRELISGAYKLEGALLLALDIDAVLRIGATL